MGIFTVLSAMTNRNIIGFGSSYTNLLYMENDMRLMLDQYHTMPYQSPITNGTWDNDGTKILLLLHKGPCSNDTTIM